MTPIENFSSKWKLASNGCWEWAAAKSSNGYGRWSCQEIGYRDGISSHRASWILHNGKIPNGLFVLHKCDNKCCVNPEHLFLGTQADNMKDRDRKGRGVIVIPNQAKGDADSSSKLTDVQVYEIRCLRASGYKLKELSEKYVVTQTHISRIAYNKVRQQECHD